MQNARDASPFTTFFPRPNQLCAPERLSHTLSQGESVYFFLKRKEHERAHPSVVSVTQDLEKSSAINVSEISAHTACFFSGVQMTRLLSYRVVARAIRYIS
jgi:hypothetical protein